MFYLIIKPVSLRLWKSSGKMSLHSIDDGICCLEIIVRWLAKASQVIKINISNAVNERSEPIDEITFHFMNASG